MIDNDALDRWSTESHPDLPLLDKELDKIRANPAIWDQEAWAVRYVPTATRIPEACGTAFCLAGNVCEDTMPAGYDFGWEDDGLALATTLGIHSATRIVSADDPTGCCISVWAADQLGLNGADSHKLFHQTNNWSTIVRMRNHLAADGNLDTFSYNMRVSQFTCRRTDCQTCGERERLGA